MPEIEAEAVAEVVADQTAAVVEEAIVEANARTEGAAEVAEAIAEGALEGERGRRIEGLEREVSECRAEMAGLRSDLQSLSNLREQVAELNGAVSTLVMAAPLSSTPTPPVEETIVVEPPAEPPTADPNDAPPVAEVVPEAPPKRKRARWI